MQQHVKFLAIAHIVLGGLGVLAAFIIMAVFGGIARFVDLGDMAAGNLSGSAVMALIGAAVTILVMVVSVPGLIAGIGLLNYRPWARILTIVISAIELPGFPLHTALGIYGLWVLLSNEGSALFTRPPVILPQS
jgi:hypothetical protein